MLSARPWARCWDTGTEKAWSLLATSSQSNMADKQGRSYILSHGTVVQGPPFIHSFAF